MATPHHLPEKRGVLKHPNLFFESTPFAVSHNMIRENIFLEHHLRLLKKIGRIIITPLIRSLNLRNLTSVITVEHQDQLVQIVISGLLLNKATVCYLPEAKINFKTLWLLLENS